MADPAVWAPAVAAAGVLIGACSGVYVALTHKRTEQRTLEGDLYTRAIDGFQDLLAAQEKHIADQDAALERLKGEVVHARREASRANLHAAQCERELRDIRTRLALLEGR